MSGSQRAAGSAGRLMIGPFALALLLSLMTGLGGCEKKVETPAPQEPTPESKAKIGLLPEGAAKPNIVFILIDALRADRLGAYGHRGGLAPTMDAIAMSGVTFERCIAPAPWTLPSVASIFTSYYPEVHKATNYRTVEDMDQGKRAVQSVLADDFTTLAEALQANGYETAGFCANKFIREPYGFAQGFDHFDSSFSDNTVPGSKVNEAAFKWLAERESDKPFFLYLHYMDVHGPYNADPKYMDPLMAKVEANPDKQKLTGKQLRRINPYLRQPPPNASDPDQFSRLSEYRDYWVARYEAGIAEADAHIKELVGKLNEMGLWDDAYIVLCSDHGEALGEHDWWDHGYSLYQTDLHSVLILRWPNVLPPGNRVRRLASLIDIMPTMLEQLRIPMMEKPQGESLVDHISGRRPAVPVARFAEAVKSGPRQFAIFAETTKLLVTETRPRKLPDGTMSGRQLQAQLFNLATDPLEQFDSSSQYPQQVEGLKQLMMKFLANNMNAKPGVVVQQAPVEEDTLEKLKAMGYVGGAEEEPYEPNELDEADKPEQPTSQPASSSAEPEATESDE